MLAPWKNSYDKPRQCIKKQRHYFADKSPYSKSYSFSSSHVWIWELDHKDWVPKKLVFLNCSVGEDSWESFGLQGDQNLKEINPEYSLDGLVLKFQYFVHLLRRASSLEKTLTLGKTESRRRSGRQRMRWLDGITDSISMNLSKLRGTVKDREVWRAAVHGVTKSGTRLSNWTPPPLHPVKHWHFISAVPLCPA